MGFERFANLASLGYIMRNVFRAVSSQAEL